MIKDRKFINKWILQLIFSSYFKLKKKQLTKILVNKHHNKSKKWTKQSKKQKQKTTLNIFG